jgi:plasmid maintenance system antidote protein VapI
MVPFGLSARALARELGVPSNRITAILAGDRGVTAETASCLASGSAHRPNPGLISR